jgi:hypothetical protein
VDDAGQAVVGRLECRDDIGGAADVAAHRLRPRREIGAEPLCAFLAGVVREHDRCAFSDQAAHGGSPDPTTSAEHQHRVVHRHSQHSTRHQRAVGWQ